MKPQQAIATADACGRTGKQDGAALARHDARFRHRLGELKAICRSSFSMMSSKGLLMLVRHQRQIAVGPLSSFPCANSL
jgi:hypothetical protein